MQDFALYFDLGWQHILDWQGYDHILFVAALCGVYLLADWRKVLFLVTAFTIGHSLTLALSVFKVFVFSGAWIEFLIPLTIVCTTLANLKNNDSKLLNSRYAYAMALFFGLIHGMGFSNYLSSLLGRDTSIVGELLAFNIGLEFGQLFIVLAILALAHVAVKMFNIKQREWVIFLSAAIFSQAVLMTIKRIPPII
jgi:hypothetical protein